MTLSQTDLRRAILAPDAPVPAGLSDGQGHPAGRRFNVYRNNVAVSLTDALKTGFPVITKLLGHPRMESVSLRFLRAHPPTSPVLMQYGAALPDFLAAEPDLADLGYLADVARLELALRQSYHAADAAPIDPADLAACPPDRLMTMGLALAPAIGLVRSPWPIFDIWRFNTQEDAPRPAPGAQDVLITRPEFDPVPALLPAGAGDWIAAIRDGASIGDALSAAPDAFDLARVLTLLLQGGALHSLTTKD